jgi:hypothetical protein
MKSPPMTVRAAMRAIFMVSLLWREPRAGRASVSFPAAR